MEIKEIQKQIPKGDWIAVRYHNNSGALMFITTCDFMHMSYTLFSVDDDKIKKLGKGSNPLELEKKYSVREKLSA